jgi:hypothetical protein
MILLFFFLEQYLCDFEEEPNSLEFDMIYLRLTKYLESTLDERHDQRNPR